MEQIKNLLLEIEQKVASYNNVCEDEVMSVIRRPRDRFDLWKESKPGAAQPRFNMDLLVEVVEKAIEQKQYNPPHSTLWLKCVIREVVNSIDWESHFRSRLQELLEKSKEWGLNEAYRFIKKFTGKPFDSPGDYSWEDFKRDGKVDEPLPDKVYDNIVRYAFEVLQRSDVSGQFLRVGILGHYLILQYVKPEYDRFSFKGVFAPNELFQAGMSTEQAFEWALENSNTLEADTLDEFMESCSGLIDSEGFILAAQAAKEFFMEKIKKEVPEQVLEWFEEKHIDFNEFRKHFPVG
jgi:hypothetical protein